MTCVIVERQMLGRSVIPECERARLPPEPRGELGPHRMPAQVAQQRLRLLI